MCLVLHDFFNGMKGLNCLVVIIRSDERRNSVDILYCRHVPPFPPPPSIYPIFESKIRQVWIDKQQKWRTPNPSDYGTMIPPNRNEPDNLHKILTNYGTIELEDLTKYTHTYVIHTTMRNQDK